MRQPWAVLAAAVAVAVVALVRFGAGGETVSGHSITSTPGVPQFHVEIDTIQDGSTFCEPVNDTSTEVFPHSYRVAVCVKDPPAAIGAFQFDLVYDDTLNTAPEVANVGLALDDNPDANEGATTWPNSTTGHDLGTGWDCSNFGLMYPKGDIDPATGPGHGRARIACLSLLGPWTLGDNETEGVLATVEFNVIGLGADTLHLENVELVDSMANEIGSCNPAFLVPIPCFDATESKVTPTPTPTPTPCIDRLGDTQCDDPVNDPDDDGCSTAQEVAMGFDPGAWYDFDDVPVPAKPDSGAGSGANGVRNKAITMGDVLAVLFYAGTATGYPPNANGVDYDTVKGVDLNGDTIDDAPYSHGIPEGQKYDRSVSAPPNPPWDAGPPNGAINATDVIITLKQAGLDCGAAAGASTPPGPNTMAVDADGSDQDVDATATYDINEPFEVAVNITAAGEAYAGYDAKVTFDPDVLAYADPPGVTYMGLGSMTLQAAAVVADGPVYAASGRTSGTTSDTGQAHLIGFKCINDGVTQVRLLPADESGIYSTTLRVGGGPINTNLVAASVTCGAPTPTPTPIPMMSHVAGTGLPGFSGDGHEAATAQVDGLTGTYDTGTADTIYFADTNNHRIRKIAVDKITLEKIINTVVGGNVESPKYCGDGGPATSACLNYPRDVFLDSDHNIYVADTDNHRIRVVNTHAQVITVAGVTIQPGYIETVAGGGSPTPGFCGDGGSATSACLDTPSGVAVDEAGNIYIADTDNHCIRRVDAALGTITTFVGSCTEAGYAGDGGPATLARLNLPHDVYPYGSMYAGTTDWLIADTGNNVIRWVHGPSGIINTLAGTGTAGSEGDDGPAIEAQLYAPEAVTADASLAVFVADTENNRIRRFGFGEATITTFAGGGPGCDEPCPAKQSTLNHPAGVAAAGSLVIANTGGATLSDVDPAIGEPVGSFGNSAACNTGVATADCVFVVLALGLILVRKQVRGLLVRIRSAAGLAPGRRTTG
jgi:hypothetical protein